MRDMVKAREHDGTVVLGISPDSVERQARFADKSGATYSLLSDESHRVAAKYGAWGPKKLYGKEFDGIIRSAFLVGPTQRIEGAWYKVKPVDTPRRLAETLAALRGDT